MVEVIPESENGVFDEDDIFGLVEDDDGRPAICRNCDYGCDEPDENGCPLMLMGL